MKKKILAIGLISALSLGFAGCAGWDRMATDMKSNINGGMQRTIKVFTANGDLIAEYEGKIDIAPNDGGYIKFDFKGRRYIYYNCFVESIAEINDERN